MANVNETNTIRLMRAYRVIPGEGRGTNALKDSSPAVNMADRVMDEIGDSFPFQVIEGGRTEEAAGDGVVSSSKGMLHVIWDSSHPTENSFLNRLKKLFE